MKNSSLYIRPSRFEILEDRIAPATLIVTNDANDGDGSLRQAVIDANATKGKDTIVFDTAFFNPDNPRTITLTSGDIDITESLVIKGLGPDIVTVDGNNASRIFFIDDNTAAIKAVTISGLTLTNGNDAGGGAIVSAESLTIVNSIIADNTSTVDGGALRFQSSGKLVIKDSQFTGNTATDDGGAPYAISLSKGSIKITNTAFTGNDAGDDGGAIFGGPVAMTKASLSIDNSIIEGNVAGGSGGGAYLGNFLANGTVTIKNTLVSGNSATAEGGGIFLTDSSSTYTGKFVFDKVTISGNTAATGGGLSVVASSEDSLSIKGSEISTNTATAEGGGIRARGRHHLVHLRHRPLRQLRRDLRRRHPLLRRRLHRPVPHPSSATPPPTTERQFLSTQAPPPFRNPSSRATTPTTRAAASASRARPSSLSTPRK